MVLDKQKKIGRQEGDYIRYLFGRHISRGQVRYLRCAHLDTFERSRTGCTFVDSNSGTRFYDCFTSAGCFNVGRSNFEIVKTLEDALDEYDMGSFQVLSKPKIEFAQKLVSICPGDLNRLVFCASGADAFAGAVKLAKGATGRNDVISMNKAYHGHEGFSLSANGKDYYKHLFLPLMPGFHFVDFNDLEAVKRLASEKIAAIVLEPVQGEGGIHVATREYITGLRKICDEHGIMLIFDEVQTGFGRTGKMWAMEQYGVIPDIMFIAKSISGGVYPNGAVVYRESEPLLSYVEANPFFHTSHAGGSDLGCIVSGKVIDFLVENKVWENAARVGKRFKEGLEKLRQDNIDIIKEVRGLGLMIGMEYEYEFIGALMAECLARQGVWAAYSGNAPQVMRFQIPTTATMENVDDLLGRIRSAVASMRWYLLLLLPLGRVPIFRSLLDNMKVQIFAFNLVRDIEDFILRHVLRRS